MKSQIKTRRARATTAMTTNLISREGFLSHPSRKG
jgi:hypothetical protein